MGVDPKALLLKACFGRWGGTAPIEGGYTILFPSPMDMPFLLRFGLEGLRHLDLSDCRQIVVLGDGCGTDGGEALGREVAEAADDRVELATVGPLAHFFVHKMGRRGIEIANWTHWAMIIEGIRQARGEYTFLHDADAFFLDADGPARSYRECVDRGLHTLGVTARLDPFFAERGRSIPGTWEMMVSTRWARSHPPIDMKGRWRSTPEGDHLFDTMLYPQFLDYPSGKVAIAENPPRLVHFAGAITTYRGFVDRGRTGVVDELFRLLFLALLETIVPPAGGQRLLPSVDELAAGLDDPKAPVTYGTATATQEYPIFRAMIDELREAPIMRGERSSRIVELLRPFDAHFAHRQADPTLGSLVVPRTTALG